MYVRFAVREKISFPRNNGFAAGGASPAAVFLDKNFYKTIEKNRWFCYSINKEK